MSEATSLKQLADALRGSPGLAAKADIMLATGALGLNGDGPVPVGDDCAAIPDDEGWQLLAIEGFMNEFVARDPWFAGWCGVMVNVSDVAAMGGRPLAVVDALWANGTEQAQAVLEGMRAAAMRFGVPIVGGHTNLKTDRGQLSVAILGRAQRLLTSFDAKAGDRLVAAIDLRGRYREPFSNFEAATQAPAERLRGDIEILPQIAEAGLAHAAKDISQGGIIGTAVMLAECSRVAISIEIDAVPRPSGVPLERWLRTFPSYGYLLAVPPDGLDAVLGLFANRDIAAAAIGEVSAGHAVSVVRDGAFETIRDLDRAPLMLPATGKATLGAVSRESLGTAA